MGELNSIGNIKTSLKHLPDGLFSDCGNLIHLDVSYNRLEFLAKSTFTGLTTQLVSLHLNNNRIRNIEA